MVRLVGASALAVALTASSAQALSLTSPDIRPGARIAEEQVFNSFGCTGKNVSPALNWKDAPAGAKSFALTVYDPDAPTGSGFWHWIVFNIPADVTSLERGAGDPKGPTAPQGAIQIRNEFGSPGYGGPCPPKGDRPHRYQFTIFAIDTDKIDGDASASPASIGVKLQAHALARATLTGVWGR